MLRHVIGAAGALSPERLAIVVGHGADRIGDAAREFWPGALLVEQPAQKGTGDATLRALEAMDDFAGRVLVLYADTPLLRPETLRALIDALQADKAVAALGFEPENPGRYGRMVLDANGDLDRIVEAADADAAELRERLCNSGVMAFDATPGRRWLSALTPNNAAGEFYLTDLVATARAEGKSCAIARCDSQEALGVNNRVDLAAAEGAFQARARLAAMIAGATLRAPETVLFSFDTVLERDVEIGMGVVFGHGVRVEEGASVGAFCHLEGCVLRRGASVGPFARIRPGSDIGRHARVGNFVEVKNTTLGVGAKANHLAYLGDATVGEGSNIGAGAITCNYDGVAKHRTSIGSDAFIGSNAALVAPLSIGSGAYIASGSVITADVDADALVIARARQVSKPGLAARLRKRLLGG